MNDIDDTQPLEKPFRIAFRQEGPMVNVYLALPDTMAESMLIGSCMASILRSEEPAQFERFREIFQVGIAAAIKSATGIDVSRFETTEAPQHEKMGNA